MEDENIPNQKKIFTPNYGFSKQEYPEILEEEGHSEVKVGELLYKVK